MAKKPRKNRQDRCPICHTAIIPEKVRKIWFKKFGTKEKPPYTAICKICGKPFGKHYGTDCPIQRERQ